MAIEVTDDAAMVVTNLLNGNVRVRGWVRDEPVLDEELDPEAAGRLVAGTCKVWKLR